ncbi:family 43 glycosylhydrolase [Niveispirillum irakense]|uniref:family 43 glycosylhydrolase n=1 Tax=Niveispirillum irakense TaxID=34011 RepID=UPI00040AD406|nr:family 43 glycosylhydrolase [Niveispirillum irakense]
MRHSRGPWFPAFAEKAKQVAGAMAVTLLLATGTTITPGFAADVAPKPLFRDPTFDGAADASIIYDRKAGDWVMFYTNRRANLKEAEGVEWVHGTRIGMARSKDGGNTWTYEGTADIRYGDAADITHWAPNVEEIDGTYHMWLTIVPGIFKDWNAPREIIHLTSKDLKRWDFADKLNLGSDRVIDAAVHALPGGGWRLWYKDERDGSSTHYADSQDLKTWTHGGVAVKQRGEGPQIIEWKGYYWLIMDAWAGLGVYRSKDLTNWEHQPYNLLEQPGTALTDRAKGGHPDVLVSDDRAFLFYFVQQEGEPEQAKDPTWKRRSVIQVVELKEKDGWLTADREQPTSVKLVPPQ